MYEYLIEAINGLRYSKEDDMKWAWDQCLDAVIMVVKELELRSANKADSNVAEEQIQKVRDLLDVPFVRPSNLIEAIRKVVVETK